MAQADPRLTAIAAIISRVMATSHSIGAEWRVGKYDGYAREAAQKIVIYLARRDRREVKTVRKKVSTRTRSISQRTM